MESSESALASIFYRSHPQHANPTATPTCGWSAGAFKANEFKGASSAFYSASGWYFPAHEDERIYCRNLFVLGKPSR
jgi:hypothetical protein